jgi:predicted acyl esterase
MAGLLRPVAPSDATLAAPGLQTWTTGPFDAPLRVFGAPNWTCVISAEAPAALHAYLDIVRAEGTVSRLTEGITRIEGHIGALRLLPTAAELPRGAALRLGIAAADQGTFEEISSTAPRLTVAPDLPCTLDLPTLPGSP